MDNLSDLDILSANWIDGHDYFPIEPDRFQRVLESFDIALEGLTFIDFGSGKGRTLLMASEYPFRQIIGLEFSPELHRIAESNITRYFSPTQKCRKIRSQNVTSRISRYRRRHRFSFSLIHVEGECWRKLRRALGDPCSLVRVRSMSRTWPPDLNWSSCLLLPDS
jgi:hypothetical protein